MRKETRDGFIILLGLVFFLFIGVFVSGLSVASWSVEKRLIRSSKFLCEYNLPRSQECEQVWIPKESE